MCKCSRVEAVAVCGVNAAGLRRWQVCGGKNAAGVETVAVCGA